MHALIKTAFAAAALLSLNLAHAADLTIHIDDVKSTSGNLLVAVYNSEGSFLKQPAKTSGTAAAMPGGMVVIKDLPEGEYAFVVFHDANSDGKLDKNFIGIPTEDYAFSNNAMGKMGPPDYVSAKITIAAAGTTARVSLK